MNRFILMLLLGMSFTFVACDDDDDNDDVMRFESEMVGAMSMEVLKDNETGLMWVNDIRGCFAGIIEPGSECADLTFAARTDWRTPTVDEMAELITEIDNRGMQLNYINASCGLMSTDEATWVFTENSMSPGEVTVNKPGNAGLRCVTMIQ